MRFRIWDKQGNRLYPFENICEVDYYNKFVLAIIDEDHHQQCICIDDCVFEMYTGIKDKNNKEIYEGDLIQHYAFTMGDTYAVTYDKHEGFGACGTPSEWQDCEVVGTIHDRKEKTVKRSYRIWDNKEKKYQEYYTWEQNGTVSPGYSIKAIYIKQEDVVVELSTGIIDKNGKPIFEGDKIGRGANYVEFSYGCFNINGDRTLDMYDRDKLEVTGTIHDKETL